MRVEVSALPFVTFGQRAGMPNDPAIYFILGERDEVLYVGRSVRLRQRWEAHPQKMPAAALGARRVAWHLVDEAALVDAELAMIRQFRPPLNANGLPVDLTGPAVPAGVGERELLTIPQAAQRIGMSRAVLWRHVKAKHLASEQHGPYTLIDAEELARFQAIPREGGRPRGSKNKPKPTEYPESGEHGGGRVLHRAAETPAEYRV